MGCQCGKPAPAREYRPYRDEAMQWESPTSTTQMAMPRLIKQETHPFGHSFYINIRLGAESPAKAMTGIFSPDGYRPEPSVDVILYLHGHKLYGVTPGMSVDSYWNKSRVPYFPLREGLAAARKNVILVAPTLGPKSQAGKLLDPNGLDRYLDQVFQALAAHGPHQGISQPTLRNLILAGHSGGGSPMRRLALSNQQSSAHIRECWGFDCLYNGGDPDLWAQWAIQHPQNRLFVYYLGSTERLSKKLAAKGMPNVLVQHSSRGHNWVPMNHWKERIEGANFLKDI